MNRTPSRASLLFALLLMLGGTVRAAEMVAIVGEDINMRSGPGIEHPVLFKISSGFPLEVIKSKGDWLEVRDFEGSSGWVSRGLTAQSPHMVVKANKGSNQQINLYSEANAKSKVVARASYGVVFKTLEKKGAWVRVEHGQGVIGWVEANFLWGF